MKVIVIGSGPSGVHFAQTALERGQDVCMVDVANTGALPPLPEERFAGLKVRLEDPIDYFLGSQFQGVEIPSSDKQEYYRLPPSKDHVFCRPDQFRVSESGINSMHSFASGGLAECWTGGAYPFDDNDLQSFPFGYEVLAPYYTKIAERIGIGGMADDLSEFMKLHDGLREPIRLDLASQKLLARYESARHKLKQRHDIRLGYSRQAALGEAMDDREGCTGCGRCLWGCPNGAFYTPSITLKHCINHKAFTYKTGRFASHFIGGSEGMLSGLVVYPVSGGPAEILQADAYVLASGTIGSSAIFLRTKWHQRKEIVKLPGLMDNRQILAPFYILDMFGKAVDPESYQYHQLAVGMRGMLPEAYLHGQITTFTTGSVHPIIQQLPLGLRSANRLFRAMSSGLGVLNLNFHDTRRDENTVTLDPHNCKQDEIAPVKLTYRPRETEAQEINTALKAARAFFRDLRAPLIPGLTQIRPIGASVHYSGTLPMSGSGDENTVSADGQSADFANLFVVDGSVFPALPAKNLTFTLMANSTRIAEKVF